MTTAADRLFAWVEGQNPLEYGPDSIWTLGRTAFRADLREVLRDLYHAQDALNQRVADDWRATQEAAARATEALARIVKERR